MLGRVIRFAQFTDLNVNLIWKHLTETPRITFAQISGHHISAEMVHKMNRHG